MWSVPGKPVDPALFRPFQPLHVLYEFEGPRTFTLADQNQELYLAHWCDEDTERVRYLVVPFSDEFVERLERGKLTLRDALDQPRLWVLDVDHTGAPQSAWRTSLAALPADILPKPGTALLPALARDRIAE